MATRLTATPTYWADTQKVYWYYKLQATEAIFEQATDRQKKSKYKHLGRAGSPEHITAVIQVVRRTQIDELERTINSLASSLLDLYYDGETEIIPEKRDWLGALT